MSLNNKKMNHSRLVDFIIIFFSHRHGWFRGEKSFCCVRRRRPTFYQTATLLFASCCA